MDKIFQKNLTITEEQQKFALANLGKGMNIRSISKTLGITYNKLHNNLRLLKKVNTRLGEREKLDTGKYFDIDSFGKYYDY